MSRISRDLSCPNWAGKLVKRFIDTFSILSFSKEPITSGRPVSWLLHKLSTSKLTNSCMSFGSTLSLLCARLSFVMRCKSAVKEGKALQRAVAITMTHRYKLTNLGYFEDREHFANEWQFSAVLLLRLFNGLLYHLQCHFCGKFRKPRKDGTSNRR